MNRIKLLLWLFVWSGDRGFGWSFLSLDSCIILNFLVMFQAACTNSQWYISMRAAPWHFASGLYDSPLTTNHYDRYYNIISTFYNYRFNYCLLFTWREENHKWRFQEKKKKQEKNGSHQIWIKAEITELDLHEVRIIREGRLSSS